MANNFGGQQGAWFSNGDPETSFDTTLYAPGMLGVHAQYVEPFKASPSSGLNTPTTSWPDSPIGYGTDGRSKRYQYVQCDSGAAIAPGPGFVAWWSNKSTYTVTTTAANTGGGRGRIAGRFPGRTSTSPSIGLGQYGWIQTQGPGIIKFIDSVTQANVTGVGNFVIPSATNGKADVIAAGSAATYPALGVTASQLEPTTLLAVVDLDVPETP